VNPITLRKPCESCQSGVGAYELRSGQAVVYCTCGKYQGYNASKEEQGREVRSAQSLHQIPSSQRSRILARDAARCQFCGRSAATDGVNLQVGHALPVASAVAHEIPRELLYCDDNLLTLCEECNLGMGAEPIEPRLLIQIIRARLAWKRRRPPG